MRVQQALKKMSHSSIHKNTFLKSIESFASWVERQNLGPFQTAFSISMPDKLRSLRYKSIYKLESDVWSRSNKREEIWIVCSEYFDVGGTFSGTVLAGPEEPSGLYRDGPSGMISCPGWQKFSLIESENEVLIERSSNKLSWKFTEVKPSDIALYVSFPYVSEKFNDFLKKGL